MKCVFGHGLICCLKSNKLMFAIPAAGASQWDWWLGEWARMSLHWELSSVWRPTLDQCSAPLVWHKESTCSPDCSWPCLLLHLIPGQFGRTFTRNCWRLWRWSLIHYKSKFTIVNKGVFHVTPNCFNLELWKTTYISCVKNVDSPCSSYLAMYNLMFITGELIQFNINSSIIVNQFNQTSYTCFKINVCEYKICHYFILLLDVFFYFVT